MDWRTMFLSPIQAFFSQVMGFLPSLLGAMAILLFGWLVAKTVRGLMTRGLKRLQLDKLSDRTQLSSVLSKGGVRSKPSELIGMVTYWLIILAVLISALNAVHLSGTAQLIEQIISFLPRVVAAIFLLVVGTLAAAFLATIVRTAASNAGVSQAHLLGQLVQTIVIAFAAVASLQQLKIDFIGEAFLIVLAAAAFGLALAFGLGCKDMAGRWMSDLLGQFGTRKR